MTIRVMHSSAQEAARAVEELREQREPLDPAFLLFFTSPRYDLDRLGAALRDHFPCPSIGCTTTGELAVGKMLEGSVVAMAFDAEHVEEVAVEAVADLRSEAATTQAYQELTRNFSEQEPAAQTLGLVLHDGLSQSEELAMSTLSNLSNVPFIGGTAGDDSKFQRTTTFVNGRPSSGGAALALLRLRKRFKLMKTQSFSVTDKALRVTRASGERRVQEFNGRPAAEEYARVLGVAVEELPSRFMLNPLAVLVGGEDPFVRSPQRVDGSDVTFYCQVHEGAELRVLESRNIVEDTASALDAAFESFGPISGLIDFHCILRKLELQQKNQLAAYGALFEKLPAVGFCTYGESYIAHINQTSTMVLFE